MHKSHLGSGQISFHMGLKEGADRLEKENNVWKRDNEIDSPENDGMKMGKKKIGKRRLFPFQNYELEAWNTCALFDALLATLPTTSRSGVCSNRNN